jgi:hypothetical protein
LEKYEKLKSKKRQVEEHQEPKAKKPRQETQKALIEEEETLQKKMDRKTRKTAKKEALHRLLKKE